MVVSLMQVMSRLRAIPRNRSTLIVGIDGPSASGKSSIALKLKELDNGVTIVQMDDFYRPSMERTIHHEEVGGNFDWKRLLEQVLAPLNRNETGRYQRYDWEADNLAEWHDVPAGGIVIVEGCFSVRNELMSFYDARFWVHSPTQVCLERVIQREKNGAGNRQAWENQYRPEEEKYINVQRPHRNADIVIDGTGKIGDLSHYEVNVIRADDGWFYF